MLYNTQHQYNSSQFGQDAACFPTLHAFDHTSRVGTRVDLLPSILVQVYTGAISGIALHGLGRVAITLLNVPRSRAL